MSRTIKIEGVIVYDPERREYAFKDWLQPDDFPDGVYSSEYSTYVLIAPYTIEAERPDDFDTVRPQLRALDRQEADLSAKYLAAKTEIEAKRQSLLAIECDPQVV
jgi:hypothetical protein